VIRPRFSSLLGALALLLVLAYLGRDFIRPDGVLAQAGDARLTQAEAQALVDALPAATRQQLGEQPQALGDAVRREVQWRALLEAARRAPQAKAAEVRARMQQAADRELVEAHLEAVSAVPADYPPQELVTATYEANRERFRAAPSYELSQIFLPGAPDDAELQKRARELVQQARGGADFADLAREHSRHTETANRGGAFGWVPEPLLRPEFRDVVTQLKTGAVSDPLPVADGWHILKLTGRRPARDLSLDEARPDIVAALREQERRRLRAEYITQNATANPVRVDEVALGKLKVSND
jgi:parvulin-like peptidyl-prolyl isomerase